VLFNTPETAWIGSAQKFKGIHDDGKRVNSVGPKRYELYALIWTGAICQSRYREVKQLEKSDRCAPKPFAKAGV
jgi:hypothetical protein